MNPNQSKSNPIHTTQATFHRKKQNPNPLSHLSCSYRRGSLADCRASLIRRSITVQHERHGLTPSCTILGEGQPKAKWHDHDVRRRQCWRRRRSIKRCFINRGPNARELRLEKPRRELRDETHRLEYVFVFSGGHAVSMLRLVVSR